MSGVLCHRIAAGWPALNINIPETFNGSGSSNPISTTGSITSVIGGSGSYSYNWTIDSIESGVGLVITNNTTVTPTFTANALPPGGETTAIVRCTVTDTVTGLTASDTAIVTLTRV